MMIGIISRTPARPWTASRALATSGARLMVQPTVHTAPL